MTGAREITRWRRAQRAEAVLQRKVPEQLRPQPLHETRPAAWPAAWPAASLASFAGSDAPVLPEAAVVAGGDFAPVVTAGGGGGFDVVGGGASAGGAGDAAGAGRSSAGADDAKVWTAPYPTELLQAAEMIAAVATAWYASWWPKAEMPP